MTQLLTNAFELPPDGWYQISALGEFPHNPTGLVQILDEASCRLMADQFRAESAKPNFPGILIDFDHFSLEKDKPSEAAGWIVGLEPRQNGLWAQIRWSDRGEQAVKGGRYRFISPVWRQDECEDLGNKRVRPRRLVNAAVTNDPNISGMAPLSNRAAPPPVPAALSVSPAVAIHFMRGALMANGVYFDLPGLMANREPMTDEQRNVCRQSRRSGAVNALHLTYLQHIASSTCGQSARGGGARFGAKRGHYSGSWRYIQVHNLCLGELAHTAGRRRGKHTGNRAIAEVATTTKRKRQTGRLIAKVLFA